MISCLSSKEIDIERPNLIIIDETADLTCLEELNIRNQNYNELYMKYMDILEQLFNADGYKISVNVE
jgi:hypothetical protein